MFKISRRMDYAVRILLELGLSEEGERVMSGTLSGVTGVPEAFMRKIIADLSRAQLVNTFAGPNGGVALARDPQSITMLDVTEAIEGPVCLNMCLLQPETCGRMPTCSSYEFWDHLQKKIIHELQDTSFDTLINQAHVLRLQPRCEQKV